MTCEKLPGGGIACSRGNADWSIDLERERRSVFQGGSLRLKVGRAQVSWKPAKSGAPVVVCVTGGRDWRHDGKDRETVWGILNKAREKYGLDALCHGGATGVDTLCGAWARFHGHPEIVLDANWQKLGKAAGPTRNEWMVRCISPDYVIAFPGRIGTVDMIERSRARGIDVKIARVDHPEYPDFAEKVKL